MRALRFRLALARVVEGGDLGECLAERGLEVSKVNRLGQEGERPPVHGGADIRHVAIGGDDHGGKLRRLLLQLCEQRQSVHARHVDVGDDHVEIALLGEHSQGLHAVAREPEGDRTLFDLTAEPLPDQVFKVGLVVDDQDLRGHKGLATASSLRPISPRSSGKSIGLVNSPAAPASAAFRRVSSSPYAVIMMTGTSGRASLARGSSSRPLMPGMLMSERIRISLAASAARTRSNASAALSANSMTKRESRSSLRNC